ncbi:MAG: signal recognition particle-docking protein FtsY [Caldiserica bacterium]|nr:signal recognition particle-docking protein FtsY [Caldisericota bacterium]
MGLFERLRSGLRKTREAFLSPLEETLKTRKGLDRDLLYELEELLILADVGPELAEEIVRNLAERYTDSLTPTGLEAALEEEVFSILEGAERAIVPPREKPCVFLIVGVNGSGKTTTAAKLAHKFKSQGKSVLLAAADTFRAAAIDQLVELGERVGVEVISHRPGADPGAVVHDALEHAQKRGYDFLLVDTAGRLQTKVPLMAELAKIRRVVEKLAGRPPDERILVIDATVGQNALSQARLFHEAVGLTGLVITKLDGTAKGGAVLPIWRELGVPILWIGVGEGMEDLLEFRARDFARALVRR